MVVNLLICIFGIPMFIGYLLFNKGRDHVLSLDAQRRADEIHKFENATEADMDLINRFDMCVFYIRIIDIEGNQWYLEKELPKHKEDYDYYMANHEGILSAYHRAESEADIHIDLKDSKGIYLASLGKKKWDPLSFQWVSFPFGFVKDAETTQKAIRWCAKEITRHHPEYYLYVRSGRCGKEYKWNYAMTREDMRDAYRLS